MLTPMHRRAPRSVLLVGPRIHLSPFRPNDRDEFMRLNRMSPSPFVTLPTTPARFSRYLARAKSPDMLRLALRRNEDDVLLGSLEVSQIARGILQSAYLGYQIGRPFEGQGYMSEAVGLILDHAFAALKLHRLEANIQPTNMASIRLVKRLGFRNEGTARRYLKIRGRWQDHQRWAILAEEWRSVRRERLPSERRRRVAKPEQRRRPERRRPERPRATARRQPRRRTRLS
jgi:[ribosomal protein S5]-alanine N-acetyltransferase